MGEKDILEKSLCAYNDVFADIVNNLLFGGEDRVEEDKLETVSVHKAYNGSKRFREIERDVAKNWMNNDIRISMLGLENESQAEDDMPIRIIGYDGASYRDQIRYEKDLKGRRKKVDKCTVITLVLYFGYEKHWNKAKTLHEALGDKLLPDLRPYVSDYRINVFEIAWLTPEQVKGFKSDFKYVADFFVQMRMTGTYVGSVEEMKHVREVLQLMATLTGNKEFNTVIDENEKTGKEGGIKTMVSVFDEYRNKGIEQGIDRHLVDQICKKLRKGKDVEEIADEVEEDVIRVKMICDIAERFSPEYDFEEVFAAVEKELLSVDA